MINKGKTFVFEAGKIIIIASVVLWFLSSFGPSSDRERIDTKYTADIMLQTHTPEEIEVLKSSERLEYFLYWLFWKID